MLSNVSSWLPQLILMVVLTLGLFTLAKTEDHKGFRSGLKGVIILMLLLWWGGFFG